MLTFVAGTLFNLVSARIVQTSLSYHSNGVLDFDDISTTKGWGDIPSTYHGLKFEGFYIFKPTDDHFAKWISPNDLNCAVSRPNALYGTKSNLGMKSSKDARQDFPRISIGGTQSQLEKTSQSFTFHQMSIKPLDMPFAYTKMHLHGVKTDDSELDWTVDFPAGLHDMFLVDIESFAKGEWNKLKSLEMWAEFHNDDEVMDWEFCLDNLNVTVAHE